MSASANQANRVKEVYLELVSVEDSAAREAVLERLTGSDISLKQQVLSLLHAEEEARTGLLDRVRRVLGGSALADEADITQALSADSDFTARINLDRNPIIGPYKLMEQLGEGGMGVVYVALQQQPIRRKVALKLIKPGMDSKQVVTRFQAERQALAMMNHPNIAKVLDAGTTETGLPYFVMDLVKGLPITEYCQRHQLDLRQRLELFVTVCEAVQHAHQKGVIHRDLKPQNVLVELEDVRSIPKVIDFGVAKALQQPLVDNTIYTGFSQMVGTPLYMSPEQAEFNSLDVDTRSDVYSLGVILYELITGSTPIDRETFKRAGFDEMRRIIREDQPLRPSSRLSTLNGAAAGAAKTPSAERSTLNAKHLSTLVDGSRTETKKLRRTVEHELDWIVMKTLEKDRLRRYESASALAADIRRYLNHEQVQACPPTHLYRLGKYARRHKLELISAGTIAALLLVATGVSGVLASWAINEKSIAQANLIVAKTNEAAAENERNNALDSRALALQQQQLAQQHEQLAKQQRDAAEYDAYVANIQLAYRNWARGDSLFKSLAAVNLKPDRPDFRGWEWYFLHSQAFSHQFVFPFQASAFAWSPTGKQLATVDHTGLVNIWNMDYGTQEKSLHGSPGQINSLAWSSDGKYLAAGSSHDVATIWDLESGRVLRVLNTPSAVHSVDWNPNSRQLAIGADDGTVTIWDAATGDTLLSLVLNVGPALKVHWHPLGHLLLGCGGTVGMHEVVIWDTTAATEVYRRLVGYSGDIFFSPDGNRIVLDNHKQVIVDWKSGASEPAFEIPGGYKRQWRPDQQRLAIGTLGGGLKILDVEKRTVTKGIPGHDLNTIEKLTWSPSGSNLATSIPGQVKVWDADEKAVNPLTLSVPKRLALSIAFHPDGTRLLEGAQDGLLKMWDVRSGAEIFSRQLTWNRAVAFSPDGKRFAAIGGDERGDQNCVVIYDADSGAELLRFASGSDDVRALDWHPNGETLAVGYRTRIFQELKGRVGLFDAQSGELIAMSEADVNEVNGLAWRPDGKQLAASEGFIRIWDDRLQEVERSVAGPSKADGHSACLAWSPDGLHLASGSKGGAITIYNARTWEPLRVLEGHSGFVETVAWHPHMPRLASGARDGTARLFDTSTGRELCVLDAHGVNVQDVAWSPDGLQLATAGHDGVVRIWDGSPADRYLEKHGDLREKVWELVNQQQYQPAIEILSQLQQLHPDERELQIQSQRLQWLQTMEQAVTGQVAEAKSMFDQLEKAQADVPDYRLYLPARLYAVGKHEAAIAMAEQFVAQAPERREYRDELGFLYESQVGQLCSEGQFAEAASFLRKLANEFPERPDPRFNLVYAAAKSDQMEAALQAFAQLADAYGDRPDYRPELARRLSIAKAHKLAARVYDLLIAENSDAVEFSKLRKIELVHISLAAGQLDEAAELLKELAPADLPLKLNAVLGQAYLDRAAELLGKSEFDRAITNLETAAELVDKESKSLAWYWLALAQLASARTDDYRTSCERMQEQFGNMSNVTDAHWLAWTCALGPQAMVDYAIPFAAAATALASDPKSVQYLTTAGAIAYRSGDFDSALVHLTEASALAETAANSSPAYTWYFLAMTHHRLDQDDEAHQWLSKANARAQEELGTEQEPKEVSWNRRWTLDLFRGEAERLLKGEENAFKP